MWALLFLLAFLASGIYLIKRFLGKVPPLEGIWLGLALGFMLAMILPALYAFAFRFSITAQMSALLSLLPLNLLAWKLGAAHSWKLSEDDLAKRNTIIPLLLPFALLVAYLQYSHNLRLGTNASYYVGQSTYGDLPLHLGIITSARNAAFPMDYSIFPGMRLSYPFLADTLSTSLYMLGLPLPMSLGLPGTLFCIHIFYGYLLLAFRICKHRSGAILAFLFLFLNGGLGFLYHFDLNGGDFASVFDNILNGFYTTPTNQPEPYNLRWSNIIADLLIPQRTFMVGWVLLLPCLYLLLTAYLEDRLWSTGELILLILLASFLPLVNTHAFLALGIFSVGQMLLQILHYTDKKARCRQFLLYGICTMAIALPQLLFWTFRQVSGSASFLKFHFNWVNFKDGSFIDSYLWFYLKNIGLIFLPILLSLFTKNKKQRDIVWSAFLIFLIAELVVFQPNHYDNNKIFYVWFALCLPVVSDELVDLYRNMKPHAYAKPIAILFVFVSLWSGFLSLARELVSNYRQFDSAQIAAAKYIEENLAEDSLFVTGTQHINPVSALAGRKIVCGPDLWLYFHGIDTRSRKADLQAFYEDKNPLVIQKYNAQYVFLSDYERREFEVDEDWLDTHFPLLFTQDDIKIYGLSSP